MNSQHVVREVALTETSTASTGLPTCVLACPICNTKNWHYAQNVRRATLSQCTNCGLLATTSFLQSHLDIEELYDVTPQNYEEYRKYYLGSRLAFYKRILPKLSPFFKTARLLEIGSGYGYFLGMASRAGWDAEGVEISKYACEVARSRGCKVHQKDLLAVDLPLESHDVVVMWDVIEHLTDVEKIVERCVALLRPGGALVARTPDARALQYTKGFFRAAYRHLAYPANTAEHIFHFTPERLSLLMARNEFQEINIDTSDKWEERPVSGRNRFVRIGRYLILRHAYIKRWPYEFVVTAVKG
jgi:2-polyprenyl-3-methyl-5-hydroxy-6-metoxy-1,4-benzoquinol methylase